MHFVGKQAVVIGLIAEGLEEICSRRTERAVRVGFECANAQKGAAEGVADADFHLVINTGNERRGIDARAQLSSLQQLGVDRDVGIFRIHVLHAGDTERCSMS